MGIPSASLSLANTTSWTHPQLLVQESIPSQSYTYTFQVFQGENQLDKMQFLLASLISLLLLQAALALPAPVATNKSLQQRFSATSKSILARDGPSHPRGSLSARDTDLPSQTDSHQLTKNPVPLCNPC
ncbi:hypothetical protein PCASD_01280 [Puccinia coronata f. sp. avenae]|uniref:Uncharacterized protein n=1 Tax=Puccinia coronata f. sp. avenae TaxID=200324 RepID=A0A2N5VIZ4_9BASI|nr:hypothetical protein PCASD_01280 [Puccinia coronata f. sp. avenae]